MPALVPIGPMVVSGPIDMSDSDLEDARRCIPQTPHRPTLLSWQVAATGFATVLVLGWLCVIALLILQERWKLVLVTCILLYLAAHFAYCYCKRNNVTNLKRQLNLRIVGQLREVHISGGVTSLEKKEDKPPSYVDAVTMDQPPPTYIMAVQYTRDNFYSEENETSNSTPNSREIILNPHSTVLTSAALPIAMALPFSPSSTSLNSLASVHSNTFTNDRLDDPIFKERALPVSSSSISLTSLSSVCSNKSRNDTSAEQTVREGSELVLF